MSYVHNKNLIGQSLEFKDADHRSVVTVLDADEVLEDGRSQWFWVRLENGDLLFACWPQGDTYFATEGDHST